MENKTETTTIIKEQLKNFIELIEKYEKDKKEISEEISNIYKDAKSKGYDTKTIKKIIAVRKLEEEERYEQYQLFETYAEAMQLKLF